MPYGLMTALALITANPPLPPGTPAPPGTPLALYCLRVDPVIGSRIETVECKTRYEWAMLGLDVDQEWAENGVKVIDRVVVTG
jgi:hypothetical protein